MKKVLLFGIVLLALNSCGTNQKEIERIHKERIEVGKSLKINRLEKLYSVLEETLKEENQKLAKINEWQLGRTQSEKNNQIMEQQNSINQIEFMMDNIKKEISLTNLFQSFEFQKTPEGTVEYIFQAAKTGDYSKMRYILDPYGEYDDDVFQICLLDIYPLEKQEEITDYLKNGRIMGKPIVNDSIAEIEIAIGYSSDNLEKIHLIKRLDKWYITSM